jgi:hypothetical protein
MSPTGSEFSLSSVRDVSKSMMPSDYRKALASKSGLPGLNSFE